MDSANAVEAPSTLIPAPTRRQPRQASVSVTGEYRRPVRAAHGAALTLVAASALTACGGGTGAPSRAPTPFFVASPGAATPPASSAATSPAARTPHILVVMEENVGYAATLGSCGGGSPDPYLCSLAAAYASVSNWYGVEHPSQPNYVDIASGANQGCTSDGCAGAGAYSTRDLGGQLSGAGIPWVAWMESMPSPCYTGAVAGSDVTGAYALKHNPFAVFRDNLGSGCRIRPYPGAAGAVRALDGGGAPAFAWISPNLCDDGHDDCGPGNVRQLDSWLRTNLSGVLSSHWFADNGTVIITMDEGTDNAGCCGDAAGGRIPMVVISAASRGRGKVALNGDHFGTLRSIEEAYGLARLGAAGRAANGDISSLLG
jgi:hypothetical protein